MKNGLKKLSIIGLGALALGGEIKEGIAQTSQDTNKAIQADFASTKNGKAGKTYVATAADFQRQKEKQVTIDSVKITEAIIMLNTHADKLIKFYGKEKLSKKVRQLMKEHPDFGKLGYNDRKPIIEAIFADFFSEHAGNDEVILWVGLSLFVLLSIAGGLKKKFL